MRIGRPCPAPALRLALALWLASALWVAPAARAAGEQPPAEEPQGETGHEVTDAEETPAEEKAAEDHDEGHTGDHGEGHGAHGSRLPDEPIPLQLEGFPERPKLLLELGNPYLGTGNIKPGVELPTGAVWQPTLILFGTFRSAVQSIDDGSGRVSELATRLDLFANLQLSGTERLVVGFRNLDRNGRFTSYVLDPSPGDPEFEARFGPGGDRFRDELNADIQTLFFEGDFGEIFPNLDKKDFGRTDVGFSIGRQPLLFQEGMLIDDSIDGLGLTRNTLLPSNTSNFRATLFLGVGDVDRSNREDRSAELLALLTSTDFRRSTVDADLVWVSGEKETGDLVAFGVSAVQRIGKFNTAFRLLGSLATGEETPLSTDGALLFSEISWTPHRTHDLVYWTAYWALDEFSSAARGPAAGGPLGRAGINFAAVGLGSYGAPLSSRAREVAGGALGYQKFFGVLKRRQLLAEVGARVGTASGIEDAAAATLRFQSALGRRVVVVVDGFGARFERESGPGETSFGGRLELQVKF